MAENDIDESVEEVDIEEGSTEGGDSEVKKIAGMSVSLIIKIAIGFVLVLVVVGVYFFFFTGEELPESEIVIEEMEEGSMTAEVDDMKMEEAPKFSDIMSGLTGEEPSPKEDMDNSEAAESTRLSKISEGVVSGGTEDIMGLELGDEDVIPEDLMDMKGGDPQAPDETELLKQQINELKAQIERKNKIMEDRESSLSSSLAVEQYIAGPSDEFGGPQLIPNPNREPALEPSWGGFDRYEYKKKKP